MEPSCGRGGPRDGRDAPRRGRRRDGGERRRRRTFLFLDATRWRDGYLRVAKEASGPILNPGYATRPSSGHLDTLYLLPGEGEGPRRGHRALGLGPRVRYTRVTMTPRIPLCD